MQYPFAIDFLKLLYDWQTLITGILAVASAGWAVIAVRAQISQTEKHAKDVLEREERAAKAVLPLALGEMSRYSRECIELLEPLVTDPRPVVTKDLQPPALPRDTLAAFQANARSAEEGVANSILALLTTVQIQHARVRRLIQESRDEQMDVMSGLNAILDAAEVYARASSLFTYARDEGLHRKPLPREEYAKALHNAGILHKDHPAFVRLNEKYERSKKER